MPNRRAPLDVLWCANQRKGASNRWSFPPAVERCLRAETAGKHVLQMFGGLSRWGVKLDIDRTTRPHVVGDAWLPPFGPNSFDVVILDPPYKGINQQMKRELLRAAAFIARTHVIWFHTIWVAPDSTLQLERGWLVRVGDSCACRCLLVWAVRPGIAKMVFVPRFTRGPALRYNRWLIQPERLAFGE